MLTHFFGFEVYVNCFLKMVGQIFMISYQKFSLLKCNLNLMSGTVMPEAKGAWKPTHHRCGAEIPGNFYPLLKFNAKHVLIEGFFYFCLRIFYDSKSYHK